jgi:hypothetical protein
MLTSEILRWLGFGWPGRPQPKIPSKNTSGNLSTDGTNQREGTNSTADDDYGTGEGPLWRRIGAPPIETNRGSFWVGGLGPT